MTRGSLNARLEAKFRLTIIGPSASRWTCKIEGNFGGALPLEKQE